MAMGPKTQAVKVEISRFDRVRHTIKQAGEAYFARPLYYLFYGLLTAGSVALLFNFKLPWQFYILMGALALVQLYHGLGLDEVPKKNSGKQRTTV